MNKNTSHQKHADGFTLIELIFATVIISMMFTIIISTFIGVLRFYTWSGITRKNQESTRQLVDLTTRLINANQIGYIDPSGSSICLVPTNPSSDSLPFTISLQGNSVVYQKYRIPVGTINNINDYCPPSNTSAEPQIAISDPAMKISLLKFDLVMGSNLSFAKKS